VGESVETATVDQYDHNFGELVVSQGISNGVVMLQKGIFIFMGGFFLLTGIYSLSINMFGGLFLIVLGIGGSAPTLMTPGGRKEVRVYEEGFVTIRGNKEKLVHFSEILSIGHELKGVYGRQPVPKVRIKNMEKLMPIYVPIQGQGFDWFLKFGRAYAEWRFKDYKTEELRKMDLSFGHRLRFENSVFIFNEGRPRETTWRVSEIKDVVISPKTLDFQLGSKGIISIHVDKVENFHIIPYIVERLK